MIREANARVVGQIYNPAGGGVELMLEVSASGDSEADSRFVNASVFYAPPIAQAELGRLVQEAVMAHLEGTGLAPSSVLLPAVGHGS